MDELMTNKSAGFSEWLVFWEEVEAFRKMCDRETWKAFYWKSGLEEACMIVASYKSE